MEHIPPPAVTGEEPPLHRIGSENFQRLVRDLLQFEPEVKTSEVFGVRGQSQFGIDVRAEMDNGSLTVAQCKSYATISAAAIREASDEFMMHLELWRGKKTARFILATSADVSDRRIHQAIEVQCARFQNVGIEYTCWSRATIVNKMRLHPEVVASYFSSAQYWIAVICGPNPPVAERTSAAIDYELTIMARLMGFGKSSEVKKWLEKTLADQEQWQLIEPTVQSRVSFLAARLALRDNDLETAEEMFRAGERHATADARARLKAMILNASARVEEALAQIAPFRDRASKNLEARLRFSTGDYEGALRALQADSASVEPDYDTYSQLAILCIVKQDFSGAEQFILQAKKLEPDFELAKFTEARRAYFYGVCVAVQFFDTLVPRPVPVQLIKRDLTSAENFRKAASIFEALSANYELATGPWRYFTGWSLAARANDLARPEDAISYAERMLSEDPEHQTVIDWVLAGRVKVDLAGSQRAYQERAKSRRSSGMDLLLLAQLDFREVGHIDVARLESIKQAMGNDDEQAQWAVMYVEALVDADRSEEARRFVDGYNGSNRASLQDLLALRPSNPEDAAALEFERSRSGNVFALYSLAERLMRSGRWEELGKLAPELLEKIPTPSALAMASAAAYNVGEPLRAIAMIDEHGLDWSGGELSLQLKKTRARSNRKVGNLRKAIDEMAEVATATSSINDRMELVRYLVEAGDTKQLAILARSLAEDPALKPWDCLVFAHYIQSEDVELARSLWRRAVGANVDDDDVVRALGLAYRLGLDKETKPLIERMQALADKGHPSVRAIPVDQIVEILKAQRQQAASLEGLYFRGEAPIHIIADKVGVSLVTLYHDQLEVNESQPEGRAKRPLFARDQSRIGSAGTLPTNARVYLDITSLLLANHLGLLELVESTFHSIRLSRFVPQLLHSMMQDIAPPQPRQSEARKAVGELIESGVIKVSDAMSSGRRRVTYGGTDGSSSFRDIAESLNLLSEIPKSKYEDALGHLSSNLTGVVLSPSESLEIDTTALITLAETSILSDACRVFQVSVSTSDVDYIRASIASAERQEQLRAWLEKLTNHVDERIRANYYLFTEESKSTSGSEPENLGLTGLSLTSVLGFTPERGDVLWVDDHGVNKFMHRDGAPIVTFLEVLRTMVDRGSMSTENLFEVLERMRRADIRFIPLIAEELVHWIEQAVIEPGGNLREIRPLTTLRNYLVRVLTDALTAETISRQREGSMLFAGHVLQMASRAIEIVEADASISNKETRVMWIRDKIHSPIRMLTLSNP